MLILAMRKGYVLTTDAIVAELDKIKLEQSALDAQNLAKAKEIFNEYKDEYIRLIAQAVHAEVDHVNLSWRRTNDRLDEYIEGRIFNEMHELGFEWKKINLIKTSGDYMCVQVKGVIKWSLTVMIGKKDNTWEN